MGRPIHVKFNGELRLEQQEATNALTEYDNGVLAATTAFGKTVTAAAIIAERKVNTLILVHTQALLEQWKRSLSEFLIPEQQKNAAEKSNSRLSDSLEEVKTHFAELSTLQ